MVASQYATTHPDFTQNLHCRPRKRVNAAVSCLECLRIAIESSGNNWEEWVAQTENNRKKLRIRKKYQADRKDQKKHKEFLCSTYGYSESFIPNDECKRAGYRYGGGVRCSACFRTIIIALGYDLKEWDRRTACIKTRRTQAKRTGCLHVESGSKRSSCVTCLRKAVELWGYSWNEWCKESRRYAKLMDEQIRRAREKSVPATLTGAQWMQIIFLHDSRCVYCRKKFPAKKLTQDHIIPVVDGGAYEWGNIAPACMPCNQKKHRKKAPIFQQILPFGAFREASP